MDDAINMVVIEISKKQHFKDCIEKFIEPLPQEFRAYVIELNKLEESFKKAEQIISN